MNEYSEQVRKVLQNLFPQIVEGLNNLSGSSVNHLRELGWETTGTFEQHFRDRFQQLGRRVSNIKLPPVVNKWIDGGKKYAADHPVVAMVALALAISCAIPVVIFLTFALITLLVTFTGFLFVEGTILGVAALVLGGALVIIGGITLSIVSGVLICYFITTKLYTAVTGDQKPHRIFKYIPYIGQLLFTNLDHITSNGAAAKIPNGYDQDEVSGGGGDANGGSDDSLAHTD
jgi:hypothetical protein